MSAKPSLDRRAKQAVALVVIVLLVLIVLAVQALVHRMSPSTFPGATKDLRIVEVGGHTMVLAPGSLERKMADWLHIGDRTTFSFELGDQTFMPGSAQLSGEGEQRLLQFTELMQKHPSLKLKILMPTQASGQDDLALQEQRAQQLRARVLGRGIDAGRVAVGSQEEGKVSKSPQLVIFLSK